MIKYLQNIINIIIIIGTVHGFFLSVMLFLKRKNLANVFLSFYLFFTSIILLLTYLYGINIIKDRNEFLLLIYTPLNITSPMFYFYIYFTFNPLNIFKKKNLLLFTPCFIYFIITILLNTVINYNLIYDLSGYICLIFNIVMNVLFFQPVIKNRKLFFDWLMSRERKSWILTIVIVNFICWIIIFLIILTIFITPSITDDLLKFLNSLIAFTISIFIYIIAYFAITHPLLFSDQINNEKQKYPTDDNEIPLKYENTDMEFTNIIRLIKGEKKYLDNELTLDDIAFQCKCSSPVRFSQIIKKHTGKNFCDFLNDFRLEEFEKLLYKNDIINILELAFQSGFNSKATFYRSFKEKFGITPGEYIGKIKQNKN